MYCKTHNTRLDGYFESTDPRWIEEAYLPGPNTQVFQPTNGAGAMAFARTPSRLGFSARILKVYSDEQAALEAALAAATTVPVGSVEYAVAGTTWMLHYCEVVASITRKGRFIELTYRVTFATMEET